jgi:hypothetical protein
MTCGLAYDFGEIVSWPHQGAQFARRHHLDHLLQALRRPRLLAVLVEVDARQGQLLHLSLLRPCGFPLCRAIRDRVESDLISGSLSPDSPHYFTVFAVLDVTFLLLSSINIPQAYRWIQYRGTGGIALEAPH